MENFQLEKLELFLKEALQSNRCDVQKIEQISDDRYVDFCTLSDKEFQEYFDIGLKSISKGEVAALVLAGGQASRLGANVPKGTLTLGTGISKTDSLLYFQTAQLCRLIKLAQQKFPESKPSIPWLIMTSNSTYEQTVEHMNKVLQETGFPINDLIIFSQNEIPTLDLNGKILWKAKGVMATNPDGNGGIYEALSPFLSSLEKRCVKYFHTFSVDNILNRVADPAFIGASIVKNADCAAKVIEKTNPYEPVGNLCCENGIVRVVEYSEITNELAERLDSTGKLFLRAANIANHVFSIEFLKKISNGLKNSNSNFKFPYHVAKKKVLCVDENGELIKPSQPNAYKLERFIFDAFAYSENFLACQVPAISEFSPLKNSNDVGVDCLDTCLRDLSANHLLWIKSAGISLDFNKLDSKNFKLFISPFVSYAGEGLDDVNISRMIVEKVKNVLQEDCLNSRTIVICP